MMPEAVLDMIEPDAKAMAAGGEGASDDLVALASIAISLRRLADALDGLTDYSFNGASLRVRKD